MLRNYLITTFRTLWKNRSFAAINISGLALGMTASVLLLLWVQDELSYDRFHRHADHIYRVISGSSQGDKAWYTAPAALAAFAKREIPGVEDAVRIRHNWNTLLFTYGDHTFSEQHTAYVDPSLFSVFDFPFISGNPRQPFPNNESVVITESLARKYFGDEDPIGKIIRVNAKDNYAVSGVINDIPGNSSIQYTVFFPFDILIKEYSSNIYWKSLETDWGNFGYATYFLIRPDASLPEISAKLTQLQRDNNAHDYSTEYLLRALPDTHLISADGSDWALQMVRIFMVVAVVILLIACINYVNLATARATKRAKEVGVRKVIGASRQQLFGQFMGESALVVGIALLLALFGIHLLIPAYNELSGKELALNFSNTNLIGVLALTVTATLLVAGIYPALLLSSFQPLQVMKGKLIPVSGNVTFRKVLVVTQFTFSIALIISTLVIGSQLRYIRTKALGYEKTNVFTFSMQGDMAGKYQSIKNEMLRQTGVSDVSVGGGNVLQIGNSTGDTDWDGKEENRSFIVHTMAIDEDFLNLFQMELAAGQGFTGSKSDSARYILNETAVRQAGISDPVGKRFKLWLTEGTIAGVVKDFHFNTLHEEITPMVFFYRPENTWRVYVKTTGDAAGAIAAAEKIWQEFNPAFPFEYTFLNESYDRMYKSDQRTGKLFNYFAGTAILISCLGLFGLAAFTAEQRTKEIGIRKVLGASVSNITLLLSRDFLVLVLLALLIASPLAWWAMNKWLEDFAYQTDISLWMFVAAGVLALLIALLTVSYQSIKAARANPVKSLRSE